MMMSQQPQQQHQPQQQDSVSLQPQPQPTTTTTTNAQEEEEEEEEEVRVIWMGDLQNWMDKVEEKKNRTLWIGDLQHWMDEAYIDSCFAHTGEVFTSKVIRYKKTTKRRYGFILFKSHAIAKRILHRFNGTPMPRVAAAGTTNFNLDWAVTTSNEIPTTTTTTTGQCGVNCMFYSTTSIPILPSIGPATNKKTVGGDDSQFYTIVTEDNSNWEDMLKWWSLSQFKGPCTAHTVHATQRVYEIASFLKRRPIRLEDKCHTPTAFQKAEGLLDELQSHTNSINVAKELHSMGALEPLLLNMSCIHAGVGACAAKIVNTMVQSDPISQQLVMEAGGGEYLLHTIFCSVNATTETNVLSAISCLYYALATASLDCQRKALTLIYCLVREHKSDCNIVIGLGYHHFMMELASGYCALVRIAALRCLLLLREVEEGGNRDQLVKNDDQLKQVLKKLKKNSASAIAQEDLDAAREEIKLVDSLWKTCYN